MARTKGSARKKTPTGPRNRVRPLGVQKPAQTMPARQKPVPKTTVRPNPARQLALQHLPMSNVSSDSEDGSNTGSSDIDDSSDGDSSSEEEEVSSDNEISDNDDEDESSEEDVKPVIKAPAPANHRSAATPAPKVPKQTPTPTPKQGSNSTAKPNQVLQELNLKAQKYDAERGMLEFERLTKAQPQWHQFLNDTGKQLVKLKSFWSFMKASGLQWAPKYDEDTMEEAAAVFGHELGKAIPASPTPRKSKANLCGIELRKKWEAPRTAAAGQGGIEQGLKQLNFDLAEHKLRARMAWAASDLKAEVDSAISGLQARVEVAIGDFVRAKSE